MKNLYLIGGTMGVGKTTVSQILKRKLNHAVFLDGDWCWDADPFIVTDETKRMVMSNICHILNSFIHCPAYENIIFCWVMHEQNIIDEIIMHLDTNLCNVIRISLLCSKDELKNRLLKDIEKGLREPNIIERSMERLPLYEHLDTIKIDVSNIAAEEAAEVIGRL